MLTCSRPESRPPPCPNGEGAAEGPPGLRCFLLGGFPGQGAHSFWEEICVAGQGPAPSFLQAAIDWHLPGRLSLGLACCTFSPQLGARGIRLLPGMWGANIETLGLGKPGVFPLPPLTAGETVQQVCGVSAPGGLGPERRGSMLAKVLIMTRGREEEEEVCAQK